MTAFATAAKSAVLFALAACAAEAAAGARCDGPLSLERVAERAGARFAALDADADGLVSRREFDAAALARRGAMKESGDARRTERARPSFAALDTDASGALSAAEFTARLSRLAERDADRDGQLSCVERRRAR